MHLYDNPDLTFGEIKGILQAASEGKLSKVSEKLDGLNLVFTWDESGAGLRVARNGGDIKTGGMDARALSVKFADRGNLSDAFDSAFRVLNQALGSLPPKTRAVIFGPDGSTWYSMELIYSANPNVIQYDGNNVVFHGWPVFKVEEDGTVGKGEGKGVDILVKHLESMQKAIKEKEWSVKGPALVSIKKMSDGKTLQTALGRIGSAMSSAGVSDSDTISDYLSNYVSHDAQRAGVPSPAIPDVAARIVGTPGAPNLVAIKKKVRPEIYAKVQEYVKGGQKVLKAAIAPIEAAIHDFAVEALRGLASTLISNSNAEVERLRGEVKKAVSAIQTSNNETAMSILAVQMQKLGAYENLAAAMEGVVFIYKGNAYKFTGAFAPVNQILGLFKYGRGKAGPMTAENASRWLRMMINEALLTEDEFDFEGDEAAAAARWKAANDAIEAFNADQVKKTNFARAMRDAGLNPDVPADREARPSKGSVPKPGSKAYRMVAIRQDPDNQFKTPWEMRTPPKKLTDELAAATKMYRIFNPEIVGYERDVKKSSEETADTSAPASKNALMKIADVKPLQWYKWETFSKNVRSFPKYGSARGGEERADSGVGPGEERLAFIFGGEVMGGGVSYDVVTPDKRKWEVKALEKPSETIRPGTEGKAAIREARSKLELVMKQLKNFLVTSGKLDLSKILDARQQKIVAFIGSFVETEYEEIVGKGEITEDRFRELYVVLRYCSELIQNLSSQRKPMPTVVGLNDKKIPVDKPTFLDVAKIVKKSTKDDEVLKPFEDQEILVSNLKDTAFRDPRAFFKWLFSAIKASDVFRQVDGCFIVNEALGFNMVPKAQFDEAFRFAKISQATPRFKFVHFSGPVKVPTE